MNSFNNSFTSTNIITYNEVECKTTFPIKWYIIFDDESKISISNDYKRRNYLNIFLVFLHPNYIQNCYATFRGSNVNSERLPLVFRDRWKCLTRFPSSAYYLCIMHERVARSSLHQVFFFFRHIIKEYWTRLSAWKSK